MHVCKVHKDSWSLVQNEVEEQQQKSKTGDFLCLDCRNDEVEQSSITPALGVVAKQICQRCWADYSLLEETIAKRKVCT